MTNPESDAGGQRFDLEERTALFGEAVIAFAKRVPVNPITLPLISQLVRAGTSVGANYIEADDSNTKKEFLHFIGLAGRESRETKHWLRMIVAAESALAPHARPLWQEGKELNLIFGAIRRRKRDN